MELVIEVNNNIEWLSVLVLNRNLLQELDLFWTGRLTSEGKKKTYAVDLNCWRYRSQEARSEPAVRTVLKRSSHRSIIEKRDQYSLMR